MLGKGASEGEGKDAHPEYSNRACLGLILTLTLCTTQTAILYSSEARITVQRKGRLHDNVVQSMTQIMYMGKKKEI